MFLAEGQRYEFSNLYTIDNKAIVEVMKILTTEDYIIVTLKTIQVIEGTLFKLGEVYNICTKITDPNNPIPNYKYLSGQDTP
jgi:hypothetical protein